MAKIDHFQQKEEEKIKKMSKLVVALVIVWLFFMIGIPMLGTIFETNWPNLLNHEKYGVIFGITVNVLGWGSLVIAAIIQGRKYKLMKKIRQKPASEPMATPSSTNQEPEKVIAKNPITFGKSFTTFLYHCLMIGAYVYVPALIGSFAAFFVKYRDLLSLPKEDAVEKIMNLFENPTVLYYHILVNIIALAFLTISIYQDLIKNFHLNKDNYKKTAQYFAILFILLSVLQYNYTSLVLNVLAAALLYWLISKRVVNAEKILEKNVLTGINILLIIICALVASFGVMYFI